MNKTIEENNVPAKNTDISLWKQEDESGMISDEVVLTQNGLIGIKHYGRVVQKTPEEWVNDNWSGWTPVENLPEENGWYEATAFDQTKKKNVVFPVYFNGALFWMPVFNENRATAQMWTVSVVAWRSLPQSYRN